VALSGVFVGLVREVLGLGSSVEGYLGELEALEVEGFEWVRVDPSVGVTIVGVDSGWGYEVFRELIVYGIQGSAVSVWGDGSRAEVEAGARAGFTNLIELSRVKSKRGIIRWFESSQLVREAQTLEVELAVKLAGKVDAGIVLFDGSYPSFVIPIHVKYPVAMGELVARAYNLWVERTSLLRELLESGVTVAFISKTSTRSLLTEIGCVRVAYHGEEVKLPDFIVVRRALTEKEYRGPGFTWCSKPHAIVEEEVGKQGLPTTYTVTFTILDERTRTPYKLTIPGALNVDEVAEIVSSIAWISPGGYPQVLQEAHQLSKLRKSDFKKLVTPIALRLETGREPLEHTLKPPSS